MDVALSEGDIANLLAWIDEIPISKPKKNITRDFSDGVATAEVVNHFCPKLVELFMYSPANAVSQKMYNWNTLNQKVFRKLGYLAQPDLISCVVANKPGYIEYLLFELRHKIDAYLGRRPDQDSDAFSDHQYVTPFNPQQQHQVLPGISGAAEGAHGTFGGDTVPGRRSVVPGHAGANTHEKDFMIHELQQTIQMLQLKVTKLEQLLIVS
ncbi:Sperm flagellar protein 1 [Podochytrium sp. JEL0797]|nr:Sperm flagellar protein 1 [Podochytrium sp. JEL0797]